MHRGPLPDHTGKIERFHKTLRAELLTGRRFDSLANAQQLLDAWVADYNTQRPHQAIAMAVPAERFQRPTAAAAPVPTIQPRQPLTVGPTEITRRVSASGLIGVCYQQVSAGRHLAGQVVTVRLHLSVLQVFFAGQLIRTVPPPAPKRSSNSEPTDPTSPTTHNQLGKCQPSPGTKPESINRNWTAELDTESESPRGEDGPHLPGVVPGVPAQRLAVASRRPA